MFSNSLSKNARDLWTLVQGTPRKQNTSERCKPMTSREQSGRHTQLTFSIHFWLLGSIAWISKRYFWQCWLDATNRGIFLNPRRKPKSEDQEQNKGRWKALLSKLETISKIDSSSDSWLMGKLFKDSRCLLLAQLSSSRSTRRHFGQQAIT